MNHAIKKQNTDFTAETDITLKEHVTKIMQQYFSNLDGEEPKNVYDFFLDEVQEPLVTIVMQYTNQNQSATARILGMSRGTLRMLLKRFSMLSV
jgi:Fis family transcriptional regulator